MGCFNETQGQRARLDKPDFNPVAGLEARPLQPLPGEPNLRLNLAKGEIPRRFDLVSKALRRPAYGVLAVSLFDPVAERALFA